MKTFQQPLTKKEEELYLTRLQEEDGEKREEAKQILIERNLRLVAHIAKKYQGTEVEMEDLISTLFECSNPTCCPHGRPTIIHFSKYDIEKMFKRSGIEK